MEGAEVRGATSWVEAGAEGEVLGERWELGPELVSAEEAAKRGYRTFAARDLEDETGRCWRKVAKVAFAKAPGSSSALLRELAVLKTAKRRRNRNRRCVAELWGSGETMEGRAWLVREGLGRPLSWETGREPRAVLAELRHALAALEELHALGFVAAASLDPTAFFWRGRGADAGLVLGELSGALPLDSKGLPKGPPPEPPTPLSGLLGPGQAYGARDDLLGMLAWAAAALGPGLPWEGLSPEEAAWLKWLLPPPVLLHRLHPDVCRLWRHLQDLPQHLSGPAHIDYALVQSLIRSAADNSPGSRSSASKAPAPDDAHQPLSRPCDS